MYWSKRTNICSRGVRIQSFNSSIVVFNLGPWDVLPPQHTWFICMGCYQASAELDDALIIRIRCVGAWKHLKPAGQGTPMARIDEQCTYRKRKSSQTVLKLQLLRRYSSYSRYIWPLCKIMRSSNPMEWNQLWVKATMLFVTDWHMLSYPVC